MKKFKPFLNFTLLIALLEILGLIVVTTPGIWLSSAYHSNRITALLGATWFGGMIILCFVKGKVKKALCRMIKIGNQITGGVLLAFSLVFILALSNPYRGGFSSTTSLFDDKNVLVIVPHQDDEINIVGGLIEQYVDGGSEVSVVFTTIGDYVTDPNIRAAEVVNVLTTLGVEQENIYYLGFGDHWTPQIIDGKEVGHIYNSPDPHMAWTSRHGKTATYSTDSITTYRDNLPYTRNNYLDSLQSLIAEKMPDTIFAIDYDSHTDHRGTSLFFEEALGNILALEPDYHPTVYKAFAYGTAWTAVDDFFVSDNLLSTVHPKERLWNFAAYGYRWDQRERFPISESNLNWVLMNNSVYRSFSQYRSQFAFAYTPLVLNGDKVFWERRTDSLLYGAEVYSGAEKVTLLNDFKIKDFHAIAPYESTTDSFVALQAESVTIRTEENITINSICLYDNPDVNANILAGYIVFNDSSRIDFSELNPDGNGTVLSFPDKTISWMEIVITDAEGDTAGLSEVEAFYDVPAQVDTNSFLMAVDGDDNFVYDHLLHGTNTLEVTIGRFPTATALTEAEVSLSFERSGNNASCRWENDVLVITCDQGSECAITVSDGVTSTTFTVSNPTELEYTCLQILRFADRTFLNLRNLAYIYHQVFNPQSPI